MQNRGSFQIRASLPSCSENNHRQVLRNDELSSLEKKLNSIFLWKKWKPIVIRITLSLSYSRSKHVKDSLAMIAIA